MTAPDHAAALAPIERNEDMDRTYIPLPGGWEVQTKGKGSTFRLADTKRDNRYAVFDTTIHKVLVQMAHDIRAEHEAALAAVAAEREACAVVADGWEFGEIIAKEIRARGPK